LAASTATGTEADRSILHTQTGEGVKLLARPAYGDKRVSALAGPPIAFAGWPAAQADESSGHDKRLRRAGAPWRLADLPKGELGRRRRDVMPPRLASG
ncbi:MAG: hypothetical protein ACRDRD_15140, partial [Pseudonocardiaceae bacterium]